MDFQNNGEGYGLLKDEDSGEGRKWILQSELQIRVQSANQVNQAAVEDEPQHLPNHHKHRPAINLVLSLHRQAQSNAEIVQLSRAQPLPNLKETPVDPHPETQQSPRSRLLIQKPLVFRHQRLHRKL